MYHRRPVLAMKRANPFADDVPVQCKFYVSEREADKNCQKRMSAVHSESMSTVRGGPYRIHCMYALSGAQ